MTPEDQPGLPLETRRAAHQAILPEKPWREVVIIEALRRLGAGATAEELAAAMGVHPQVCRPRLTEMHKRGMVAVVGRRLSLTSKKWVGVYMAPPQIA